MVRVDSLFGGKRRWGLSQLCHLLWLNPKVVNVGTVQLRNDLCCQTAGGGWGSRDDSVARATFFFFFLS
jgi:hypothetical protein